MMLKSAPWPWLVFGSRLVQNICICTFFKDGGEMHFTIKTAFVDEIFLALIPTKKKPKEKVPALFAIESYLTGW